VLLLGRDMKKSDILVAWAGILRGRRPFLSIEITKECPLRCPGCYAYEPEHLGGPLLRQLSDFRGEALVTGVLDLVREYRPLHISIVGGEPLVRFREFGILLPKLTSQGIEVQLVTSAVRPIPSEWTSIGGLHLVVSIDGLQPEHDARRFPATYERILENIAAHKVIVHCTITRQMLSRKGYLAQFTRFWSDRGEARKIWFSLYTPQEGDCSEERLRPEDRVAAARELADVRRQFPKVDLPEMVLREFLNPPDSPERCIFSQVTTCFSADLHTRVTPCQFGGRPVCSECGCIASMGMASLGNFKLAGLLRVGDIYTASRRFGQLQHALESGQ
jgi:MoaA/NifB/PqqE/SkfB family radical SAM enzyme